MFLANFELPGKVDGKVSEFHFVYTVRKIVFQLEYRKKLLRKLFLLCAVVRLFRVVMSDFVSEFIPEDLVFSIVILVLVLPVFLKFLHKIGFFVLMTVEVTFPCSGD